MVLRYLMTVTYLTTVVFLTQENGIMMFTKLIHLGYYSKMLDILHVISMYSKTTPVVKWKGMLSATFCDLMGVAQGVITSPFLYILEFSE